MSSVGSSRSTPVVMKNINRTRLVQKSRICNINMPPHNQCRLGTMRGAEYQRAINIWFTGVDLSYHFLLASSQLVLPTSSKHVRFVLQCIPLKSISCVPPRPDSPDRKARTVKNQPCPTLPIRGSITATPPAAAPHLKMLPDAAAALGRS